MEHACIGESEFLLLFLWFADDSNAYALSLEFVLPSSAPFLDLPLFSVSWDDDADILSDSHF
jgi:hypothetical protein